MLCLEINIQLLLVWARGPRDLHDNRAYEKRYFGRTSLVERADRSKLTCTLEAGESKDGSAKSILGDGDDF